MCLNEEAATALCAANFERQQHAYSLSLIRSNKTAFHRRSDLLRCIRIRFHSCFEKQEVIDDSTLDALWLTLTSYIVPYRIHRSCCSHPPKWFLWGDLAVIWKVPCARYEAAWTKLHCEIWQQHSRLAVWWDILICGTCQEGRTQYLWVLSSLAKPTFL